MKLEDIIEASLSKKLLEEMQHAGGWELRYKDWSWRLSKGNQTYFYDSLNMSVYLELLVFMRVAEEKIRENKLMEVQS